MEQVLALPACRGPFQNRPPLSCRTSRWIKRGIAVVPTKFGIAFGILHMNQVWHLLGPKSGVQTLDMPWLIL